MSVFRPVSSNYYLSIYANVLHSSREIGLHLASQSSNRSQRNSTHKPTQFNLPPQTHPSDHRNLVYYMESWRVRNFCHSFQVNVFTNPHYHLHLAVLAHLSYIFNTNYRYLFLGARYRSSRYITYTRSRTKILILQVFASHVQAESSSRHCE